MMKFVDMSTKIKVLVGVTVPLVLMVILGVVSWSSISRIIATNDLVAHSNRVMSQSDTLTGSTFRMITGLRGYLLAGQDDFLAPYRDGGEAAYAQIAALQADVSDSPEQLERLTAMAETLREWQEKVTEPTIQLRQEIGYADTMMDLGNLVGEARGKTYFDALRAQGATFSETQRGLVQQREAALAALLKGGSADPATVQNAFKGVIGAYMAVGMAKDILATAVETQSAMRGYLLAGKDDFLQPYQEGLQRFDALIADLTQRVGDSPAQVALLGQMSETLKGWQSEVADPDIGFRRLIGNSRSMDDMADLVGEQQGKVYTDKFQSLMNDFKAEEQNRMDQRRQDNSATVAFTNASIIGGIVIGVLLGGVLAWMIGNGIANPIVSMTQAMGRLADGDKSVDVPGVGRGDEVGHMALAVQVFKDNSIKADEQAAQQKREQEQREHRARVITDLTRNFDQQVTGILDTVAGAAETMESSAHAMTAAADQASQQSTTVADAAQLASENVQTVATASEELSNSIDEISRQVSQSTQISTNAVTEVEGANEKVHGLAEAASKIGEVVALITDIADQTNLLALNATIEAARAGDAGKGFAVVASEVKNLANQTAKATEEISNQISGIQGATDAAVVAIGSIGGTISEMSEIVAAIASAVEEQGAATQGISRSVEEAARGTQDVTTNIAQVSQAASETGQVSNQVLGASRDLAHQSVDLKRLVETFLTDVRAA